MSDFQSIVDRFEIEALRGEFTDTVMMRDPDRLASLFTEDGVWRIPQSSNSPAGSKRLQGQWDYFVQNTHPGTIQLLGDTAVGRAYISELIHLRDGSSHLNYAVYHDRYQRIEDGWKFAERVYEVRYLDPTPLAGSAPHAAEAEAKAPRDSTSSPKGR
jgi:ketosteroid isomerase-like protein